MLFSNLIHLQKVDLKTLNVKVESQFHQHFKGFKLFLSSLICLLRSVSKFSLSKSDWTFPEVNVTVQVLVVVVSVSYFKTNRTFTKTPVLS